MKVQRPSCAYLPYPPRRSNTIPGKFVASRFQACAGLWRSLCAVSGAGRACHSSPAAHVPRTTAYMQGYTRGAYGISCPFTWGNLRAYAMPFIANRIAYLFRTAEPSTREPCPRSRIDGNAMRRRCRVIEPPDRDTTFNAIQDSVIRARSMCSLCLFRRRKIKRLCNSQGSMECGGSVDNGQTRRDRLALEGWKARPNTAQCLPGEAIHGQTRRDVR